MSRGPCTNFAWFVSSGHKGCQTHSSLGLVTHHPKQHMSNNKTAERRGEMHGYVD